MTNVKNTMTKSRGPLKPGRPKNQEKRQQILIAAAEHFLQSGVSATSMEMVAKSAHVSKQTVYSHFSNKDALFSAVIDMKCQQYHMDAEHLKIKDASLAQVLTYFGQHIVGLLHDESVIAMYRVVIAEADTNPHVAELFYQAGPQQAIGVLSDAISRFAIFSDNKNKAEYWAVAFSNLLKSDFHMRSLIGLPYALCQQEQVDLVQTAVSQLVQLIEADQINTNNKEQ